MFLQFYFSLFSDTQVTSLPGSSISPNIVEDWFSFGERADDQERRHGFVVSEPSREISGLDDQQRVGPHTRGSPGNDGRDSDDDYVRQRMGDGFDQSTDSDTEEDEACQRSDGSTR